MCVCIPGKYKGSDRFLRDVKRSRSFDAENVHGRFCAMQRAQTWPSHSYLEIQLSQDKGMFLCRSKFIFG